jgi:hypothetical protein
MTGVYIAPPNRCISCMIQSFFKDIFITSIPDCLRIVFR